MPLPAAAALLLLAAPAAASAPARIMTPGCQGEGCLDTGHWVAERDVPLFPRIGAAAPMLIIRKGARVKALGGTILTSRVATAILTKGGDYPRPHGDGQPAIPLARGTRFQILHYAGEGHVVGRTGAGDRFTVTFEEYRELSKYRATDWVRLRLAGGRTGWTNRRDLFACSSHYDLSAICR